jgi:ribonuclease P protein component
MFSFPPESRLHNSRQYSRIWREGSKYHTAHLMLIAAPGLTPRTRLGITVSRKVGNAVCRNRIKRWIREYFRLHVAAQRPPVDLNVVVKRRAGNLSHDELDQELRSAFARLEADGHA